MDKLEEYLLKLTGWEKDVGDLCCGLKSFTDEEHLFPQIKYCGPVDRIGGLKCRYLTKNMAQRYCMYNGNQTK